MKKLYFLLLLSFFFAGCVEEDKGPKEPSYEANAVFFIVNQINASETNNPYICKYELRCYNLVHSSDATTMSVYDTIGKYTIQDTIYLRKVFPPKKTPIGN